MNILIKTMEGKNIDCESFSFSGGERHIQIKKMPLDTSKEFNIKAVINSSDDLLDLLLINNALCNHYKEKVIINLEIPYMPYARQDRVCAIGQAFSMELMAQLLNILNLKRLVTWDCHSQVGLDLTGAVNISSTEIIQASDELVTILQSKDSVLICPDNGALARCEQLQATLNISEMVRCEKRRDPATGRITHTDVLVEDLSGKTAVITDDICDGGYTFIKIAEQLKEKNVDKVVLYVTHGIFSKGLEVFDGLVDLIFTTNSFLNNQNVTDSNKLVMIDYEHEFTNNL